MRRPVPTPIMHFTHVDHLSSMASEGMVSDNAAREQGLLEIEIGNTGIKDQRRDRVVPVAPHGTVADYVPF